MMDFRGRTALVTGASAGIGRELARSLSSEVGCLVLVARRTERLSALSEELSGKRKDLQIVVRSVDLADRGATGRALDELEREGLAIDILVNNAGFGDYGLFDKRHWSKVEQMLELNVVSATYLLHRLIPLMVARRFGAVLNVGSIAGIIPSPGMGAYAASKAYMNHLSEALRAELAGTGVSVTALCPGPVRTEFQSVAGTEKRPPMPEAFYVDAAACAEQGINALKRGRARVIPGAVTRGFALSVEAIPKVIARPMLSRVARKLRNQR